MFDLRTTRRKFIKLSSVLAVGAPLLQKETFLKLHSEHSIIIVGAGIAGLTAAYELQKAGITDVTILEANNRVGGRTHNIPVDGGHVAEGGGQWIGGSQTAIKDLLSELNISTFPSYTIGENSSNTSLTENEQADFDRVVSLLEEMASTILLNEPWNSENAQEWDNIVLGDWLSDNHMTIGGYVELYYSTIVFLGEPESISLLYFLYYVQSAGSIKALLVDAQELRISGGAQQLALQLAANISIPIILESPVDTIEDNEDEVIVISGTKSYTCDKVIVAMMPKDANNINFTQGLSPERIGLQENWIAQSGMKVSIVFSTPFWREEGLNGTAYGNRLFFITDNSPEDGSVGILVAFPDDQFQSLPNKEQVAIDELVSLFGPKANDYIDYVEKDWGKEDYIGGCVSPIPPNILTQYGAALKEPVGNIHWSGTESSTIWTGYMDGAVRSGLRVVGELLDTLSHVEKNKLSQIKIHPNPCTDFVYITSDKKIKSLLIYNADGKQIYSKNPSLQQIKIKTSKWMPGMYYLHVKTEGHLSKHKMVKT